MTSLGHRKLFWKLLCVLFITVTKSPWRGKKKKKKAFSFFPFELDNKFSTFVTSSFPF